MIFSGKKNKNRHLRVDKPGVTQKMIDCQCHEYSLQPFILLQFRGKRMSKKA